jgi:hypothetical protein
MSLSPRSDAYSPPHPAHTGTNVHAHALARRPRRSADRNRWPTCPFEQAEQALGNESGSRGVNVPVALRVLAIGKEPLRNHEVLTCANHPAQEVRESGFQQLRNGIFVQIVARCIHFLQSATLLDVTDHGLTTVPDLNSLYANDLRSAAPQPAQRLDQNRKTAR